MDPYDWFCGPGSHISLSQTACLLNLLVLSTGLQWFSSHQCAGAPGIPLPGAGTSTAFLSSVRPTHCSTSRASRSTSSSDFSGNHRPLHHIYQNLVISKGQKRLHLLRKLKSFDVDKSILIMFYRSFIETVLTFAMICWFYGLNVKSRSQKQSIVNLGSKITGSVQLGVSALCEKNVLRKSLTILDDTSHILYSEFDLLPSGRRYRVLLVEDC